MRGEISGQYRREDGKWWKAKRRENEIYDKMGCAEGGVKKKNIYMIDGINDSRRDNHRLYVA